MWLQMSLWPPWMGRDRCQGGTGLGMCLLLGGLGNAQHLWVLLQESLPHPQKHFGLPHKLTSDLGTARAPVPQSLPWAPHPHQ